MKAAAAEVGRMVGCCPTPTAHISTSQSNAASVSECQ